jgi:glutathione peroxidase
MLTEKQRVRGADAHPFYAWAKATLGEAAAPRWNFHKDWSAATAS